MFSKKRKNKGNKANNTTEQVEGGAKKPRYHITIVDTKTGNTFADNWTNALIGGMLTEDERGTEVLGITSCQLKEIAYTILGALTSIHHIVKNTGGKMEHLFLNAFIASTCKSFGWNSDELSRLYEENINRSESDDGLSVKFNRDVDKTDDGFFS